MTGNYFWICGIVPYKQTKMGMIHCLNRSKIALFTPGYARFQPFGTVSNLLHGNQIRVLLFLFFSYFFFILFFLFFSFSLFFLFFLYSLFSLFLFSLFPLKFILNTG